MTGESGMYEQMVELAGRLDLGKPRAARLEVGLVAHVVLMAGAAVPSLPASLVDVLAGVPVVRRVDMDPWAWRLLDQHGAPIGEGRVSSDLHKPVCNDPITCGKQHSRELSDPTT